MPDPFIPELNVPVLFRTRPLAIPGELRPAWRISVVVLLLRKCCRQGRSSLRRLHVLSWATKNSEVQETLIRAIQGEVAPDTILVRIEPALNRAVDFAEGEGLLRKLSAGRVELTGDGKEFADEISKDPIVLGYEKAFMDHLRFEVTEDFVKGMFERGATT